MSLCACVVYFECIIIIMIRLKNSACIIANYQIVYKSPLLSIAVLTYENKMPKFIAITCIRTVQACWFCSKVLPRKTLKSTLPIKHNQAKGHCQCACRLMTEIMKKFVCRCQSGCCVIVVSMCDVKLNYSYPLHYLLMAAGQIHHHGTPSSVQLSQNFSDKLCSALFSKLLCVAIMGFFCSVESLNIMTISIRTLDTIQEKSTY